MLLGNPHFPWQGSERFYQAQLTIPGKINASGASLFGVPVILIGHTDNMAWSHTVSTAYRFTPFEETLNPADPTQYLYDGGYVGHGDRRRDGDREGPRPRPRPGRLHPRGRRRAHVRADAVLDPARPGVQQPRRRPASVDQREGVRDGRRQRGQLPLPQPLLRDQPGPERRGARRRPAPKPGHPVGKHDRRRLLGQGLLRRHLGHPPRHRRAGAGLQHGGRRRDLPGPAAADPRRVAHGLRVGERPRRRSSPEPSAPRRCRRCFATTTSRT